MKLVKTLLVFCFVAAAAASFGLTPVSQGQSQARSDLNRTPRSGGDSQDILVRPIEAQAGFDSFSNGFTDQTTFAADRLVYEEREGVSDGLGPLYNAQSCAECHQSPITGAGSQVTELRAGHFDGSTYEDHPGGSLINDRSIYAGIQEFIYPGYEIRALRATTNTLGDGYVEAIADDDLIAVANAQPGQSGGMINGQYIMVPVLEGGGITRVGRFGWKDQHASLESFAGDAYLNEMGITSPMFPTENTSNGSSVAEYDTVADPEDDGDDLEIFARFMRATKAPPRELSMVSQPNVVAGGVLFQQVGCAICHVTTFTTVPGQTVLNGGTFVVNKALGSKIIHPYSDFLLHDVGTGDGIVQNGGAATRNKMRTVPLWGLRTRARLMHDGSSLTRADAIMRHGGEATQVISNYSALTATQKSQILSFLGSL
jgi:CxxC motif-containing protein (DUF1111 family)